MRRRGLIIIVALLLVVIAIAALFLILGSGGGGTAGPAATPTAIEVTATPEAFINVVAASQNLSRGAVIPADGVQLIPWPITRMLPAAITDTARVIGTRARYDIPRGDPILSTMVVASLLDLSAFGSDAAAQIPPGMVAITLPYNKADGVALGIQDGDHVNVIVSWMLVDLDEDFQTVLPNLTANIVPPSPGDPANAVPAGVVNTVGDAAGAVGRGENDPTLGRQFYVVPSENQRPRMVTQGIIQDAVVLHLGDFGLNAPIFVNIEPTAVPESAPAAAEAPAAAAPAEAEGTATPPPPATPTPLPPDSITLMVSYQDALVLEYVKQVALQNAGAVKVTFALRSAGDTSLAETESVTLQYMFERFAIALPSKLAYGVASGGVVAAATATPVP